MYEIIVPEISISKAVICIDISEVIWAIWCSPDFRYPLQSYDYLTKLSCRPNCFSNRKKNFDGKSLSA